MRDFLIHTAKKAKQWELSLMLTPFQAMAETVIQHGDKPEGD